MRIAIVAHARLHTFDLARALLARGHTVRIITNEPLARAAVWGLPPESVRSWVVEGRAHGAAARLPPALYGPLEPLFHTAFGRWAARQLEPGPWDLVLAFSGVAEESLALARQRGWLSLCGRGSAHIRVQDDILAAEEARTGRRLHRPSPWRMRREEREYALADGVYVPSSFVRDSFRTAGVAAARVRVFPYAVDVEAFRPDPGVVAARRQRLLSGAPLRCLTVGQFSLRKGAWDLAAAMRELAREPFRFHLVGGVDGGVRDLIPGLPATVTLTPRVPQMALPAVYAEADLFVLPTLEDGYAVVLAQATGARVPLLTTPRSAGPDLIRDGSTGWLVPPADPRALIHRLRHLEAHRTLLVEAVEALDSGGRARDWIDLAGDVETYVKEAGR